MLDYPFDLGRYRRPVTTSSEAAQIWFDRGLNWVFGYNHEEAGVCFQNALEADPGCAMASWGRAYVIGPNYNRPWEAFTPEQLRKMLAKSRAAIRTAKATMGSASEVEQALILALEHRYPSDEPAPDLSIWSTAYAQAMREVYARFPEDPDVATLFAESMMNRTPWQMWDLRSGQPEPGSDTLECREVLEDGLQKVAARGAQRHPGLLHLYIHLMEMSPVPEVALRHADELRELVPAAGHLAHMATHIDVLCGHYQDVVTWNHKGILADEAYWRHAGAMNFYSLYRVHNYHFKLYGAMFLGQFRPAMEAVEGMMKTIPDALVRCEDPPMADWLEGYLSIKTHALIRFGRWQALIDDPLPEHSVDYAMTTALNWYGKGIAYAALQQPDKADEARRAFEAAAARVPDSRYIHVVPCTQILAVAREMLNGEVEYHRGKYDVAFARLRQAVVLEDALPYDEPWPWMMPSRHPLGALLMEQGHHVEAAAIYEADLGLNDTCIRANRHPSNVWALKGLHACYLALGQTREAAMIKPQLDVALSRADPGVYASCFCSGRSSG
ncbi:hypothetical protein So717_02700 [Roseobacter cerasinus]|uniref:TPR domain protein n=1 Tax=Roseobacter cerasinus TaxID=2602289 RepID=A0A640VL89_9RHOB|nr:hypothetical protein [Roseobacter cerasinus]GFE48517.1 hypothetical protein So717_02700 [Roseobacter cerasinus]